MTWILIYRRVDSLNLESQQAPYGFFEYDHPPPPPPPPSSSSANRYPMPEAYIEGQELYLHFFHEQVRSAGLAEHSDCLEEDFE